MKFRRPRIGSVPTMLSASAIDNILNNKPLNHNGARTFQKHYNACSRCKNTPWNLCAEGTKLLANGSRLQRAYCYGVHQ